MIISATTKSEDVAWGDNSVYTFVGAVLHYLETDARKKLI